jgi:hypothetical protein
MCLTRGQCGKGTVSALREVLSALGALRLRLLWFAVGAYPSLSSCPPGDLRSNTESDSLSGR